MAVASDGARVLSSDVPDSSRSDSLRSYPRDLLSSPLEVTSARVTYEPGEGLGDKAVHPLSPPQRVGSSR